MEAASTRFSVQLGCEDEEREVKYDEHDCKVSFTQTAISHHSAMLLSTSRQQDQA